MARPLKQGISYFQHDTDASNDSKLELVEYRYKNDGYAIFFKILEKVYSSGGKFNITSETDFELYGNKWHVGSKKLKEILEYFREIKLFFPKKLVSNGVKAKLVQIEEERERKRLTYKKQTVKPVVSEGQNSGETPPSPNKDKLNINQIESKKEIETKTKEIENWGGSCLNGIDLKVNYLNKEQYAYNVAYNHYPKKYGDHAKHLETFRKKICTVHDFNRLNLATTFYKEKFTGTIQQMKNFSEFILCYPDYL